VTAQNPPANRSGFSTVLWTLARFREAGITVFILILVAAVTLRNPAFLTADNFQDILLNISILAIVALGPSKLTLILVVGVLFTPIIARSVRAAVLSERELEYVAAARLRNERTPYVLFGEILPNVMGPVMVEFTVRLGYAIFAIATLTFLGFGIQPPAPDWGLQVFEHYGLISGGFWWTVLFPALAITSLVVGVNLLADGVSKAFGR